MKPSDIKYIVVHCSATLPKQDIGVKEISDMHRAKGWAGIGYHAIIRQNGVLELGRSLDVQGAHVGEVGHNHHSWGVCLIGGLDNQGKPANTFSQSQLAGAVKYIKTLLLKAPNAIVLGHRDLSPDLDKDGVIEEHEYVKQCPCFDVVPWWKTVS